MENGSIIERAIQILPNVKKYVKGVEKKPPKSKNYETIKTFLEDDLLDAKLHFMRSVTLDLEPFLKQFQSNDPLLPFLYQEVYCTQ